MQRSFAMRVYAASYAFLTLTFGYIFLFVLAPAVASDPQLGALIPILGVFLALFVIVGALAAFWKSAPGRPSFWLLGLLPAVAFILMNAEHLPYAATHPSDAAFPATLPLILWTVVVIVAGYVAYGDAKRGSPGSATAASGERGLGLWGVLLTVGISLGIAYSGILAQGAGGGGGPALAAEVSQADTLVAQGTKYLTTTYTMKAGGVLGLFVVNHDPVAHSFDIDALNVHVSVPANGTVAISVKPTAAGTLEFYCAIPGHKQAGMAGTITVQ